MSFGCRTWVGAGLVLNASKTEGVGAKHTYEDNFCLSTRDSLSNNVNRHWRSTSHLRWVRLSVRQYDVGADDHIERERPRLLLERGRHDKPTTPHHDRICEFGLSRIVAIDRQ